MQLRWYTTYNKDGLDSDTSLQFRENEQAQWEDVPFVREREFEHDEQEEE